MVDQLTEIDRNDLPKLRDLYKPGSSRCYIAYMTIGNYIRLFNQDPHVKHVKFYCLNGDLSHGTFVVTDRDTAIVATFNESTDELLRLLLLLDFTKGYVFISFNDREATVVREAIKQKGIEIVHDDFYLRYFLAKEEALQFNVQPPDGIELKPLIKRSDIEKAHSVWPLRGQNSVHFLMRQAKYNQSVGAFTKDGTLVAWVFQYTFGMILALQTDKDHYGHGYGSLMVKAISKQIAEMGYDLYTGVAEANTASRRLFEKLGFEVMAKNFVICTKLNWTDDDE